ncbi:MAG: heparinase II/III family protein [Lentisphaeria bacterium]|nr:heparinase II/III family protein [Lentisphaeria bacterium]
MQIAGMVRIMGIVCVMDAAMGQAQDGATRPGHRRVFEGDVPYTVRLADKQAVADARERVRYVLSLDVDQVRALVPTASGGVYFTDCPNCDHGTQDHGRFDWSPEKPERLTCRGCGATYPGNPDYPDDQFIEVAAPKGTHRFHYYERPDGYRIFLRAHADWWAKDWLEKQARDLAELYHATGGAAYARRAADILVRFAEVYPGYAVIYDYPHRQKQFASWTVQYIEGVPPYRTSKWSWWAIMDISIPLTAAYDAIRGWDGLAEMAGGDAARMIEEDLLGGMVRYNLGTPDWQRSTHQPRVHKLLAATVLKRPDWVHEAVRRYSRNERIFLYDGGYQNKSPSYMAQMLGTLRSWNNAAAGYSDPPGFIDPVDGTRFDDLDLAELFPLYGRLERALLVTRFPDGRLLPVNDTWSFNRRGGPRENMEPVLMPGMGVAVLGGGAGERQIHAYLNFTDGIYHNQKDALSIGLFAHGHELLPDIGYTHTRYRLAWTNTTMSHNTVAVNGRETTAGHGEHLHNRLREYVIGAPGFQLVSAKNPNAYPGTTDVYERTLALVGTDARDAYLLDVFHVSGGTRHDYLLHGSADADSTATLPGLSLSPFDGTLLNPGVVFVEPQGENSGDSQSGFGLIRELRCAEPAESLVLDIRLDDAPEIGTRTLLAAAGAPLTPYLGRSPSIRRAKESDARLNDYHMPTFAARRDAANGQLETVFTAAHEPVRGTPRLESLTSRREGGGLLVVVRLTGERTDYFAMRLDGSSAPLSFATPDGDLTLDGAWGLVRVGGGTVTDACLVGGERLALGPYELTGQRGWSGKVLGLQRRRRGESGGWFEVDAAPSAPHGAFILTFADDTIRAFTVIRIEPTKAGARIYVAEDPGIEVGAGEVRSVTYPQRVIHGETIRWRLAGGRRFIRTARKRLQ